MLWKRRFSSSFYSLEKKITPIWVNISIKTKVNKNLKPPMAQQESDIKILKNLLWCLLLGVFISLFFRHYLHQCVNKRRNFMHCPFFSHFLGPSITFMTFAIYGHKKLIENAELKEKSITILLFIWFHSIRKYSTARLGDDKTLRY